MSLVWCDVTHARASVTRVNESERLRENKSVCLELSYVLYVVYLLTVACATSPRNMASLNA